MLLSGRQAVTTPEEAIRLARALREARHRLWECLFSYERAAPNILGWAKQLGLEPVTADVQGVWEADDGRLERFVLARFNSGRCIGRVRANSPRWRAYMSSVRRCAAEVRAARDAMVTANMPLATYLSKRACIDEDVCQGAYEGLIVAVDRFRPDRGVRFSTYARFWIQHKAIRTSREHHMVKMGERHLKRQKMVLEASPTGTETMEEIAAESELSVKEVENVLLGMRVKVDVARTSSDAATLRAVPLVDPSELPDAVLMNRQMEQAVRASVEALEPRARTLIHKRYLNGRKATLPELGREFGRSREWARLLEREAFYFMGEAITAAGFAP